MDAEDKKAKAEAIKNLLFPECKVPDECDVCHEPLPRVGHSKQSWPLAQGNVQLLDGLKHYWWYLCAECTKKLNCRLLEMAIKRKDDAN